MAKMADIYLKVENRPKTLRREIDIAYNKIVNKDALHWGGGKKSGAHQFALADETYILLHLINTHLDQKVFNFFDVGAGNFFLGRKIKDFINYKIEKGELPSDLVVNIVLVRGENNPLTSYYKQGNCNIYELGSFQVENLLEELNNNNLGPIIGKFDLTVSFFCMGHLVDPMGLFDQIYRCSKIHDGVIITDAFDFEIMDSDQVMHKCNVETIISYLPHEDKYLIRNHPNIASYPIIVINKHAEQLKLPFKYHGCYYISNSVDGYGKYIEILTSRKAPLNTVSDLCKQVIHLINPEKFGGDESLFKDLVAGSLLVQLKDYLITARDDSQDNIPLMNKYQVYNLETFIIKLTQDIKSIELYISGGSNDFKYARQSYECYEFFNNDEEGLATSLLKASTQEIIDTPVGKNIKPVLKNTEETTNVGKGCFDNLLAELKKLCCGTIAIVDEEESASILAIDVAVSSAIGGKSTEVIFTGNLDDLL